MPVFKVSLAAARRILKLGTLRVPVFNIQGSKKNQNPNQNRMNPMTHKRDLGLSLHASSSQVLPHFQV